MEQNQEFPYLTKIPILKTISEMKQPDFGLLGDPRSNLDIYLSLLFTDSRVYIIKPIV